MARELRARFVGNHRTAVSPSVAAAPATFLVGDIGATHARFGLVSSRRRIAAFPYAVRRGPPDDRRRARRLSGRARPLADAPAGSDRDRLGDHRRSRHDDQSSLGLFHPGAQRPVRLRAAGGHQRFHRAGAGPSETDTGRSGGGRRRRAGSPGRRSASSARDRASACRVSSLRGPGGFRLPGKAGMRRWRRRPIGRARSSG